MMMDACIKIAGLMGMSPSVGVALLTVLQMACVACTFGYLAGLGCLKSILACRGIALYILWRSGKTRCFPAVLS